MTTDTDPPVPLRQVPPGAPASTEGATSPPLAQTPVVDRDAHRDALLDEALVESFPASDPVAFPLKEA